MRAIVQFLPFAVMVPTLVTAGPLAAGVPTTGAPLASIIEPLRVDVERERESSGTPGVQVALMVGGEIIWSEGFGWSDVENEIPVTPETRFGIGSISKTLTMITCARLVDEGDLDWDAPVETYLPEFPHAGRGITIRSIGAHLSGMGDDFADSLYGTSKPYTTVEAYREVVKQPLAHDPWEAHLYATGPFTVIAEILETVEGMTFPEVVAREATGPLELEDTLPNDPRADIPNRARFYVPSGDSLVVDESNYSHVLAGGGYLSTATDLVTLGNAALLGDFLSEDRRKDLITDMKTSAGAWTFFGLGWQLGRSNEWGFFYANSGGGKGFRSVILVIPDSDLAVAVCTNLNDGPAWEIAKMVADRVVEASR